MALDNKFLTLDYWLGRDDVVCKTEDGAIVSKDDENGVLIYLKICTVCGTSLAKCVCDEKTEGLSLVFEVDGDIETPQIENIQKIQDAANKPASKAEVPVRVPKANREIVRQTLTRRYKPGQPIELRVPNITQGDLGEVVWGGVYTDHEALIRDVGFLVNEMNASAIYTGLQEIGLDEQQTKAFVKNSLRMSPPGAAKENICRYRWLLVDIDTVRPAEHVKSSSTDAEKNASVSVLNAVIDYFSDLGFEGDVIDSGNSFHFVLPLDLEATQENETLIQKVLEGLATKFDTDKAKIDQSVYDRPRICKLPGTPARKGVDTKERPHRWSSVLSEATVLKAVPLKTLLMIAGLKEPPKPVIQIQAAAADIRDGMNWVANFLAWGSFKYGDEKSHEGGLIVPIISHCPFDHDSGHHENECHAGVNKEGKYCFKCQHDSCRGRGWKEFRAQVEQLKGECYVSDPVVFSTVLTPTVPTETVSESVSETPTVPTAETKDKSLWEILDGKEIELTERWVASIFNLKFGEDYLFSVVNQNGEWMRWSGQIWKCTTLGMMQMCVGRMSAELKSMIKKCERAEEQKALRSLANKCDSLGFVERAFRFLEAERETQFQDFDKKPHLFNFTNGTYDLDRQEFRSFRREDLLTQMAGVAYCPDATCPMFLKFLENSFPSLAVRGYLQRWFGYCLTGTGIEKAAPIFHGLGDNGKTVMLDVIMSIGGSYGCFCEWNTFAVNRYGDLAVRNDLARLHNARLVCCDESSKHMELNQAVFKKVVGNSTITARFLHKEFFSFVAGFKLMLATNSRPRIVDGDSATWARIHDIKMDQRFKRGDPRRIENLLAILTAEKEGIAAWMVEGYKKFVAEGLNPPIEVLDATAEYEAHSDIQAEFFNLYAQGDGLSISLETLYKRHKGWSEDFNEPEHTLLEFQELLTQRGYRYCRKANEAGRPNYVYGLGEPSTGGGEPVTL